MDGITFIGFDYEKGSFTKNTKNILDIQKKVQTNTEDTHRLKEPIQVEYHFITFDEIFNKNVIAIDREHCDACWRILGELYEFFVISEPYTVPQEICLRFPCYYMETIDEIAFEFAALVSTLTRAKIIPIGIRRIANYPKHETSPISDWKLVIKSLRTRYSAGINPVDLLEYIKGLVRIDDKLVERIFNTIKMYYLGLITVDFNPSIAYVLLVSSIETLAQIEVPQSEFSFEDIKAFKKIGPLLNEIRSTSSKYSNEDQKLIDDKIQKIKTILTEREQFTFQKFKKFIKRYTNEIFWNTADEKYGNYIDFYQQYKEEDIDTYLSQIYRYRSKYSHSGIDFPNVITFGIKEWLKMIDLKDMTERKSLQLPTFIWFERLVHFVIVQYLNDICAPGVKKKMKMEIKDRRDIFQKIERMSKNMEDSLSKLVYETSKYAGYSLMGPHIPNKCWADSSNSVKEIERLGLISCDGYDLEKSSVIIDQETGIILGDYFLKKENPFRHYMILLPRSTRQ